MANSSKINTPKHVGIIMDGNGRWAIKNSLKISEGHKKGVSIVKDIVEESVKQDLSSLDKKYSQIILSSLSEIDEAIVSLKQAYDINQEIFEKSKDYLPILNEVRGIQRVNFALNKELEEKLITLIGETGKKLHKL